MNNDNIKLILHAFNNECDTAISKVKLNNIEQCFARTALSPADPPGKTGKCSARVARLSAASPDILCTAICPLWLILL
jgi:hypothetical protein